MKIDKVIIELKILIDDVYLVLIKQFEQIYLDFIGIIEVVFDELKWFFIIVCEMKIFLQLMLEKGFFK